MECATLTIKDDNEVESAEFFTVIALGGTFLNGQGSVVVDIVDNDGKYALQ